LGRLSAAAEPELSMPARRRQPGDLAQQVVPLVLLGIGLISTNRLVTFIDEESTNVGAAAAPLRVALAGLFSGSGQQDHPPLYDALLHFWMLGTGGNFDYLRIPSALFFIAGLFLLGRASRFFTGSKTGGSAVIWLGVLWPFSFHFGRLATWYSLSFFLVAGLTFAYFQYLEAPDLPRWVVLCIFSACLVWTSYFGLAILACLAIDQVLRLRSREAAFSPKKLLETTAVVLVSFLPLIYAFRAEISKAVNFHQSGLAIGASTALHVYSLFVSESVAPWNWWFSIPASVAIVFSIVIAVRWLPREARRFLIYAAVLIFAMALGGVLQSKHLLPVSAWVLLPLGVAVETVKPRWATYGLAAALLAIGATGWYGVYSRRFYSAPRFIEPWQEVATDAAAKIRVGATVIADHPSFLLYLTYNLHAPAQNAPWEFKGLLPDTVQHPHVFSPAAWLAAGHPTAGKMILIRGDRDASGNQPMDDSAKQLDQSCGSISSRLRMRDEGYKWKQRFFPQMGEPQWRIEIREYDCTSTNSKEIYQLPPR
jgi:hypothetical protein